MNPPPPAPDTFAPIAPEARARTSSFSIVGLDTPGAVRFLCHPAPLEQFRNPRDVTQQYRPFHVDRILPQLVHRLQHLARMRNEPIRLLANDRIRCARLPRERHHQRRFQLVHHAFGKPQRIHDHFARRAEIPEN